MDKLILKFQWKHKGPEQPRQSVRKSQVEGQPLSDVFSLSSCGNQRHIHGTGPESEINPCIYGQLIFDKCIKGD